FFATVSSAQCKRLPDGMNHAFTLSGTSRQKEV
ncbi:MAG: hypothetical protein ACJA13_000535, partial [Paraglaciecola sp.]